MTLSRTFFVVNCLLVAVMSILLQKNTSTIDHKDLNLGSYVHE